ncbi:MAG: hypothetical protein Q4G34_00985 [Micrococcus sp.]|nr:hypothetical protein [Micrococcus sp.]
MATTEELLRAAEQSAWQVLLGAPDTPMGDRHDTQRAQALKTWHREGAERHLQAWPALATAALRLAPNPLYTALDVGPEVIDMRMNLQRLTEQPLLSRQPSRAPDANLERVAQLLNAVADLEPGYRPEVDARAQRIMHTVARMTLAHVSNVSAATGDQLGASEPARWALTALADRMGVPAVIDGRSRQARESRRSNDLGVEVVAPERASFEADVVVWVRSARRAVSVAGLEASSAGFVRTIEDLAWSTRAAAALLEHAEAMRPEPRQEAGIDAANAAARGWAQLAAQWPLWLGSGGRPDPEQVAVSSRLRAITGPLIRGGQLPATVPHYPGAAQARGVGSRMLADAAAIGATVAASIQTAAARHSLRGPTRVMASELRSHATALGADGLDLPRVPPEWLGAMHRGGWSPVPPTLPTMAALTTTAHDVARRAVSAEGIARTTFHRPAASLSTRYGYGYGYDRGTVVVPSAGDVQRHR